MTNRDNNIYKKINFLKNKKLLINLIEIAVPSQDRERNC